MNRRIILPGNLIYALTVLAVLLGLNFLLRVCFLLYNFAQWQAITLKELGLNQVVEYSFEHHNVPFAMRLEKLRNFNA